MLVVNTSSLEDYHYETIGFCEGNVLFTHHIFTHLVANCRNFFGGENEYYTKQVAKARDLARERMIKQAKEMGADAILSLRYSSSAPSPYTTGFVCSGTAVKLCGKKDFYKKLDEKRAEKSQDSAAAQDTKEAQKTQ